MFQVTEKFTDYNDVEREETFYFNLTKAEAIEFENSHNGGISTLIKRIIATQDQPELIKLFKTFMRKTYGVKSDDGRRFIKNDAVWEDFSQTEAYSSIFMRLATDEKFANEFISGVVPKDVREQMKKVDVSDLNNVRMIDSAATPAASSPNA